MNDDVLMHQVYMQLTTQTFFLGLRCAFLPSVLIRTSAWEATSGPDFSKAGQRYPPYKSLPT